MKTLNLIIKSDIITRDEIRNLFNFDFINDLDDVNEIIVNMKECSFLSRSPAHELVKQIQKLKTDYKIDVKLEGLQFEVEKMLDVVNKSITSKNPQTSKFKIVTHSTNKEFFSEIEKM
jgi:hypothetical protein